MKFWLTILLFFLVLGASATHNRSGEITYERISPFTQIVGGIEVPYFRYRITVIKYTDDATPSPNNNVTDRCDEDSLFFGDGQFAFVERMNGGTPLCPGCVPCKCLHCGEMIITEAGFRVKKNIYVTEHTYPGPGNYLIRSFDPNRNEDVINIPNSDDQPFYIESLLVINGFTGANTSPEFKYDPIDRGCLGKCFTHNPGAFDADGDSLSYLITTSRGVNGQTVLGYTFPEAGAAGQYKINAETGLLTWCVPQKTGEYNIAFIVNEWRKNTGGGRELIGYVLRDMQVLVRTCPDNDPPHLIVPADTCVEAGTFIQKKIIVSDPDNQNLVTIIGQAGAFSASAPVAALSKTVGTVDNNNGLRYEAVFSWQTSCDHIRQQPYQSVFKVEDNGFPKQVFFSTYAIRVIPPAVKNVKAAAFGSSIKINWDPSNCKPVNNPLISYKIYRQNGCGPFIHKPCATGISDTSKYKLIGTVAANQSTFTDDNKGDGLVVGQNYSYVVIAVYADGTLTFGSSQVCAELKRDVPVVTNVDVISTSTLGTIDVKWVRPLTTPGNLDLNTFKGPYRFDLKHRATPSETYSIIYSTTKNTFTALEEAFSHTAINTTGPSHEYLIDFFSDTVKVGSSQRATSISLTTTPSDRRVDLTWSAKTPWDNYNYIVFRQSPGSSTFVSIGSSTTTAYADTSNLENGKGYCYFVRSQGEYSDASLPKPLINNSQISCTTPLDLTPPVTPTLSINANCPNGFVVVTWSDITEQSDDVDSYELYYKPTISEPYSRVSTVKKGQSLTYNYDGLNTISGCYAVLAIDINKNKGALSPDFCIENCPEFELPNVFSPNGDSINDFYKAIKVRQIKEIDLSITDRWGNLVYQTRDPYFHWNGISQVTNLPVSEGTFFYVCHVFEPRIKGILKRTFRGHIQVIR